MNPQQKALLTAAWEALGPEPVTRGLQASGHTWNDCFIGRRHVRRAGCVGA